jgi:hypothetical protein
MAACTKRTLSTTHLFGKVAYVGANGAFEDDQEDRGALIEKFFLVKGGAEQPSSRPI